MSNDSMLISICIPTHHGRDWCLREAIESILPQITDDLRGSIQICVSDNASQDTTREMMLAYAAQNPGLFVYHRNPESIDAMLNIMKSVEIASGTYCWFLGSDDVFMPNAVCRVAALLEEHPGISGITVNRVNYDKTLTTLVVPDSPLMLPAEPERSHVYRTAEEILLNCSMMQNFLSAQTFRRDLWREVVDGATKDDLMYFWLYLHSYVLGTISKRHPYWVWCPERLVKFRTGNEAFVETLTFEQYANNNMVGIKRQWSALLGESSRAYKKLMADFYRMHWDAGRCHSWKVHPAHTLRDDWVLLRDFVACFRTVPRFWVEAFPFLLIPHGVNKLPKRVGFGKLRLMVKSLKGSHKPAG